MSDDLSTITDIAKGIILFFVGYVVISFVVGALISPFFSDVTPSKEVVRQCVDGVIAGMDRNTLNDVYLKAVFDRCRLANTVAAAYVSTRLVFIVFAIGIVLFVSNIFVRVFYDTKKIKADAAPIKKSNIKDQVILTFSRDQAEALILIVKENKNKDQRYNKFIRHPMFEDMRLTKKDFLENIERLVRDYVNYDMNFIEENLPVAIDEVHFFLNKGGFVTWIFMDPWQDEPLFKNQPRQGEVLQKLQGNKEFESRFNYRLFR
tara:strand:- start:130 stop:915 length:786 start_codon:yes stop_codon:yes gene_type:complete